MNTTNVILTVLAAVAPIVLVALVAWLARNKAAQNLIPKPTPFVMKPSRSRCTSSSAKRWQTRLRPDLVPHRPKRTSRQPKPPD